MKYLVADLSRDASKLGVVGKGGQVFDSFEQWSRSDAAPVSVLLGKIPILSLKAGRSRFNVTPGAFGGKL